MNRRDHTLPTNSILQRRFLNQLMTRRREMIYNRLTRSQGRALPPDPIDQPAGFGFGDIIDEGVELRMGTQFEDANNAEHPVNFPPEIVRDPDLIRNRADANVRMQLWGPLIHNRRQMRRVVEDEGVEEDVED